MGGGTVPIAVKMSHMAFTAVLIGIFIKTMRINASMHRGLAQTMGLKVTLLSAITILAGAVSIDAVYADAADYPSPFQQQQDGISLDNIQCNVPRELYIRDSQVPVCISASTYDILLGYGVDLAPSGSLASTINSITDTGDLKVQRVVEATVSMYDSDKENAFASINSLSEIIVPHYPFVLDPDTRNVVAHGAFLDRIGTQSVVFSDADKPYDVIIDELQNSDGTWVEYVFLDPVTETELVKRSWLTLHDGYVFGSGYYYPIEEKIYRVVSEAIALYEPGSESPFAAIDAMAESVVPHYPFVLDPDTRNVVAHGAFLDRIGTQSVVFSDADKPYDVIIDELQNSDGTWVEYVFLDPVTETELVKRSWLTLHDGYVFGSGYYYPIEEKIYRVVSEAIALYEPGSESPFAAIDAMAESVVPHYPFVLDLDGNIVAHGAFPDVIGTSAASVLETADKQYDVIIDELQNSDGTWAEYVFLDPVTETELVKRSWFTLHDGYVFGSGYYYPIEEKIYRVVGEAIALYEPGSESPFAAIDAMAESVVPHYPFVLDPDTRNVVAHGAFPDRIGGQSVVLNDADKPYDVIIDELQNSDGTWVEYVFLDPVTETELVKRSWLTLHDGYVFGSGYYLTE